MQGYIKRLTQEIEKTELRRNCLKNFLDTREDEIDQTQKNLMVEQGQLMDQLLVVMKQRLEYEQQIHPERFEDLPEEDCEDDSEE